MSVEEIKELIKNNIIIILILLICIIMWIYYIINNKNELTISTQEQQEETQTNISEAEQLQTEQQKIETPKIKVHIVGMVKQEGVYELEEDSRVIDAIETAGGALEAADLQNINLVEKIEDGVQIKIPQKHEERIIASNTQIDNNKQDNTIKSVVEQTPSAIRKVEEPPKENKTTLVNEQITSSVNINTATEEELQTLTGIGPVTAKKIIEYRNQSGKFNSIEEIKNVSGIGEKKYDKIKNNINI